MAGNHVHDYERPASRARAAAGSPAHAAPRRGSASLQMPVVARSGILDRLRAKLQAAQTFLFGALFFMTDQGGRQPDVIRGLVIPVALVVTDACQLLSLALSGAWYAPSVKWLTAGVGLPIHFEAVPTVAFALYWTLAALLVGTFLLIIYASYMFKQHSFRVLPIRILCFIAPLLVAALYIPCLRLLATPFFCLTPTTGDTGAPNAWVADFCDAPLWTRYLTLSVSACLLLLYVPFAALIAAVFHDNDPLSVDISARAHGRLQLAYVLFQSALVFARWVLEGRHPVLFASFLAVGCLLLATITVVLLPHYSSAMNMLRAGCFLAAAVFALGSITLNYADPSLSMPISITFILLLVPVALLGAFAVRLRSRGILRRVLRKARTGFAGSFDMEAEGADESEGGSQFRAGVPRGRRVGLSFGFLSRSKGLLVEAEVELEARAAIAAMDEMPDALATAEAIYEEGMNRHKGSQYVALHYAMLLHVFLNNRSSANVRLRLAERSPRRSIDMSFFLAAKRREWTQREYSASLGEAAGVSAIAVLEFQMLMDEATRHQNDALRETRLLWRSVAKAAVTGTANGASTGDAASNSMRSRGGSHRRSAILPATGPAGAMRLVTDGLETRVASIQKSKRAAEIAYKRLLSRFARSPNLWRAYAYFLLVANETREANAAFGRADELEESAALEANLTAAGGSLVPDTVDADEVLSESASSKLSKAKRDRQRGAGSSGPRAANPVSKMLMDAALGGTRAVRDLRRAIVAACAILLVLLVILCAIAIAQVNHQDYSLDVILSAYFLPRSAVVVVDSARSAVLAASSATPPEASSTAPANPSNITTATDALAAVLLHANAFLDTSKRLYYGDEDRASHLWEETWVDTPVYVPAGPQSPAAAVPLQMTLWDAVAMLVAKAKLLPPLPAPAAMTAPDFRYVADVGMGTLRQGLDTLSEGYRAHFRHELRVANDVFVAILATICTLAIIFAFGVFRPLVNRVTQKKLDLSTVILRIPRAVAKLAARHYANLHLVTADSSEEEVLEGLDDMNHFDHEDETERESDEDLEAHLHAERLQSHRSNSRPTVEEWRQAELKLEESSQSRVRAARQLHAPVHPAAQAKSSDKTDAEPRDPHPAEDASEGIKTDASLAASTLAPYVWPAAPVIQIHALAEFAPAALDFHAAPAAAVGDEDKDCALALRSGGSSPPFESDLGTATDPSHVHSNALPLKQAPSSGHELAVESPIPRADPVLFPDGGISRIGIPSGANMATPQQLSDAGADTELEAKTNVGAGTLYSFGAGGAGRSTSAVGIDEAPATRTLRSLRASPIGVNGKLSGSERTPSSIRRLQAASEHARGAMGLRTPAAGGADRGNVPEHSDARPIAALPRGNAAAAEAAEVAAGRRSRRSERYRIVPLDDAYGYSLQSRGSNGHVGLERNEFGEGNSSPVASQSLRHRHGASGQDAQPPPALYSPLSLPPQAAPAASSQLWRTNADGYGGQEREHVPAMPSEDVGGEVTQRQSFLQRLGIGSRTGSDEGAVYRLLRLRMAEALLAVILVAAGTFLACFLMSSRSENAAAEIAATGRISSHVAAIATLAREPYVGDGVLGVNGSACAARVQSAMSDARTLFNAIKFGAPIAGTSGAIRRTAEIDEVLHGSGAAGLTFTLNTYFDAALRTLNTNGLLGGAGAAPGAARYAGWPDAAAFGDGDLRLVRTTSPALGADLLRLARLVAGDTRGTIGRLRSILIAVLVIDVAFFALLYYSVFKPMLGRLVGETSRAFQLVAMLPTAALEAHHLWQ